MDLKMTNEKQLQGAPSYPSFISFSKSLMSLLDFENPFLRYPTLATGDQLQNQAPSPLFLSYLQ